MLWDYYAQQVDTVHAANLELGNERLSMVHQHLIHCLGRSQGKGAWDRVTPAELQHMLC